MKALKRNLNKTKGQCFGNEEATAQSREKEKNKMKNKQSRKRKKKGHNQVLKNCLRNP